MKLPEFLAEDRYGRIHLAGHRIGLKHIVDLHNDSYTVEMLHEQFPTLSVPLIHKVLAFYLENRTMVDAYVTRSQEDIDRQAAMPSLGPTAEELRKRMESLRARESA